MFLPEAKEHLKHGVKFKTNATGLGVLNDFYESEVLCDKHEDVIYVKPPEGRRGFKCHHLKDTDTSLALNLANQEAEFELL